MHRSTAFEARLQPHLRPVRADDAPAMGRFLQTLSTASRRLRFHGAVRPDSAALLAQLTQADGQRQIALVAVLAADDGDVIVGEARCVRSGGAVAEFAIAVADAWQGRGVAGPLLRALLAAAAAAGIEAVVGGVLAHNGRMAGFLQREGFVAADEVEDGVQRWQRTLAAPAAQRHSWRAWIVSRLDFARVVRAI